MDKIRPLNEGSEDPELKAKIYYDARRLNSSIDLASRYIPHANSNTSRYSKGTTSVFSINQDLRNIPHGHLHPDSLVVDYS